MAHAHIRWRRTCGRVLGLVAVLAALEGCRLSGRRALLEGDRRLQAGRPTEAVPLLERAAADLQTDGAAWNLLGRAYHELGRVGDARKAYLRALQVDRNLFDAHFNMGQLALESGAWREAEAGYRTWLGAGQGSAASTGGALAWRGLGIAQLRQGNANEAEHSFGSALRLDDKDAESWNAVGLIRQQRGKYREAFNTFAHAARLNPQFAAPHLNAAIVAHQHLNDRRAALEYYRSYLALNPPNAAAISQLIAELDFRVGAVSSAGPAAEFAGDSPGTSTPARMASNPPTARTPPIAVTTPTPGTIDATPKARPTSPAPSLTPRPTLPAPVDSAPVVAGPATKPKDANDRTGPAATGPPAPSAPLVSVPVVVPAPVAPDIPLTVAKPASPTETANSKLAIVPLNQEAPKEPSTITPAPLEIIRVEDRPTFRPARDPIPSPAVADSAATVPISNPVLATETSASKVNSPPVLETAASSAVNREGEEGASEPSRRSLWSKANPMNWFKRDRTAAAPRSSGKPITPLEFPPLGPTPLATESAPATPVVDTPPRRPPVREVAAATTPTPAPVIAAPVVTTPPIAKPKPVFQRYTRQVSRAPEAGDHAAAEREFQTALEAHRRKDLQTAMTAYQQVVALDPAYFEAQYNLALAAVARGDLPVALRAAETATALRPTDAGARYQFAVALQRSRHPLDAAAELEEIARLQQTNAASHLAVAQLYANDLEEPERARLHYEKVLALDSAHPEAASIRRWLARNPAKQE